MIAIFARENEFISFCFKDDKIIFALKKESPMTEEVVVQNLDNQCEIMIDCIKIVHSTHQH